MFIWNGCASFVNTDAFIGKLDRLEQVIIPYILYTPEASIFVVDIFVRFGYHLRECEIYLRDGVLTDGIYVRDNPIGSSFFVKERILV